MKTTEIIASNRLVKIHLSDDLFTTAKYDDVEWNEVGVWIKTSLIQKFFPWHRVMSLEIFEAE